MDNIFKRFTCLFLALLMILEVFSPVTALAAEGGSLFEDPKPVDSTNKVEKNISEELFNGPSTDNKKVNQKDTRKKEEEAKKATNSSTNKGPSLVPGKKTKDDYKLFENTQRNKDSQKQAEEKAKAEAKAAEEAKALEEEQAAKEKADLEKIEKQKQDLLRIEAERQAQAARASEAEAAAAEAEYRDAREKRIELEKILEEKLKEKGLRDQDKESEKSLNKEKSNKLEDKNKTEEVAEEEEEKGLLEKIKEGLGLTDLQRADKELKKALKNKKNDLEEIQTLLNSFEDKYDLSREDQAKLMADSTDAFREFIERHGYENFDPQMFMVQNDAAAENDGLEISDLYENLMKEDRDLTIEEMEAGLQKAEMPNSEESSFVFFRALRASNNPLDEKKFTIRTRFDTSISNGPIKAGQYFDIHLDEKLTVKDPSTLKIIVYNNQIIATPEHEKTSNTIRYKIVKDIYENLNFPLNIDVDFNTGKITENESFTVINSVSGLGVTNPKSLLPVVVDKNGNTTNTIIEAGRNDVIQIIDPKGGNYRVPVDLVGEPVIDNKQMVGINWSMRVHSDTDLKALGYKANFTTVKGSGLGEIENVKVNGVDVSLTDQLEDALGIVDSKHHNLQESTRDLSYTFYTPVTNIQGNYLLDISVFLQGKQNGGAIRFFLDQGYTQEKIIEATPTRVGINNRTTIQGQFLANDKAQWTITDAISSGDEANKGMPLEDRSLDGEQTITSGKSAVYGIDTNIDSPTYGQMVVKEAEKTFDKIPGKETDPAGTQEVGNIAVYEFDTELKNADKPSNYNISGIKISKFRDLYIDQVWNFPLDGMTMPGQDFIAKDNEGNEIGKVHVEEGAAGEKTRFVTIPKARYWDIDEVTHKASKRENKIEQKFDQDTVKVDGKTYKYYENANYYQIDTKSQFIHNSAIEETNLKPVSFTVVKVDSKDPSKKLSGARFKLLGDNQPSIVTDDQGRASFNNVLPGTYTLIEEKAPDGYRLDQGRKTITISEDGNISVNGGNVQIGGSTSATN